MKKLSLVLLAVLMLPAAEAQTPVPTSLLRLISDAGYTRREDARFWSCDISTEGKVKNTLRVGRNQPVETSAELDAETVQELAALVGLAQTAPSRGHYQNGSGDLPHFEINAYPDSRGKPLLIAGYSMGCSELVSDAADELTEKALQICGMEEEIHKFKDACRF